MSAWDNAFVNGAVICDVPKSAVPPTVPEIVGFVRLGAVKDGEVRDIFVEVPPVMAGDVTVIFVEEPPVIVGVVIVGFVNVGLGYVVANAPEAVNEKIKTKRVLRKFFT